MKITYITHACLLIETDGLKILTDPWLIGPCWGGSLWHYPTHKFTPKNLPTPDIIFFSHGHDDHFHHETINSFPDSWKKSLIIAPSFKMSWWEGIINKYFKNVKYLEHNELYTHRNKIKFQLFLNDRGEMDSSIKISSKTTNLFLQTDNLMSLKEAKRISKIEKIDVAFVIPFLTGIFPGFYKWDSDTLLRLAKEKILRSLKYSTNIVKALKPKYVIPYACDLGYLGDKFHINLIHTHNKSDLVNEIYKKKITVKPIILNSGDYVDHKKKLIVKKKNKELYENESLIKFHNEKNDEYLEYQKKENAIKYPKYKDLINIFIKNLKRNITDIKHFNFKTKIKVNEREKETSILIDFKTKKINLINGNNKSKINLIIEIESSKIRNLVLNKYPMNFMTFHNGGYMCERKTMNLTENEKKYWGWINNLDFFI
jgi:hypothetical protein